MLFDLNDLGKWIKEQRNRKGISQAKLAKIIGASQDVISLYETGKSYPNYSTLINLINGLGYSAVIELHILQDERPYNARQRIEK